MALRRGIQRLVGVLGVLLPLCAGCMQAPEATQPAPASSQQPPASQPPPTSSQQPEASPQPQATLQPAPVTPAQSAPQLADCPLFPADNIWNVPVDTLPVDPNSDLYIDTIGAGVGLHPDFGAGLYEGGPIGIPYIEVGDDQAKASVSFEYGDESDAGGYPIPSDPTIEGGPESDGDRHILMVDRDNCILYELFYAFPQEDGSWTATSGAIFDLKSHDLRPDGWTSADAAGLPILPGLVRYDEVAAGEIRHALRFTVSETSRAYVWPARHFASSLEEAQYPPMGQRFRLKADFDMSGFSPEVQVILRALQKYGMMLADNGSPWFISGAPDERWNNDTLRELRQVQGADFEAVDVSSLQTDPDSGQARMPNGSLTVTPPPANESAATTPPVDAPDAPPPLADAPAADLFVDDDNTTGVVDGSALNPYTTVQEAIDGAASGAVIAVAAGTYPENIRVQDKAISLYGGYEGGSASDYSGGAGGDFSARDSAANPTHIQGDGEDSVVTLVEAGASILDGFHITGGSRSVEDLPLCCYGGGIYVKGGTPTISNNVIENNDTTAAAGPDASELIGGGIFAQDADISIRDNIIRNNTSGRGGGIALFGGNVIVDGNTVQGNVGVGDHGGGLYVAAPSAEITRNRIVGNEIGRELGYGWGGGVLVFNAGSVATLSHNLITANYAPAAGSGVFIDDGASAVLEHELIYANECTEQGGAGIYVDGAGNGGPGSTLSVIHTTVASHDCDASSIGGNAVYVTTDSTVTILNSILWDNAGDDIVWDDSSEVTTSYTLSEEAIAGSGNLSTDPLFADPASGDYHLRSTAGRWDPATNGGAWNLDSEHSPAIDAGDPASPFADEPEPNGGQANMGAYGNTPQASKSVR